MQTRFKKKANIYNVVLTAVSGMLSVGVMLYAVGHFGLDQAWDELILNMFYIACLVMMWMYFFNRLNTQRFNYWSSGVEDLFQVQSMVYFHRRCRHRSILQLRHLD